MSWEAYGKGTSRALVSMNWTAENGNARPEIHSVSEIEARIKRMESNVLARNSKEPEFIQAFTEVCTSLRPLLLRNPKYIDAFETIAEPERCLTFRVTWFDDNGVLRVNRGFRVQYSSALGPFKGGLRFHPSVNMSVIKFLGFEQVFKNSLTGLQLGGGKGGADFDPKGKSEGEIRRFCQSFMTELARHIGPARDVPAGDIGVGGREIGFLFGQYKRLTSSFEGSLTGKDPTWGGSLMRPEATGYGAAYFAESVLQDLLGDCLDGKKCVVSGAGNVAIYCAVKLMKMGGTVLTLSDSNGTLYCPKGFSEDVVLRIGAQKAAQPSLRVESFADGTNYIFMAGESPWSVRADVAFPCATQNELNEEHAKWLCSNGCLAVVEGANMPVTPKAVAVFIKNNVIVCPGKASNAGGVAVSSLEMSQNAQRMKWTAEEVDAKLKRVMRNIFEQCVACGKEYGRGETDLIAGANCAGFINVANAVMDEGYI